MEKLHLSDDQMRTFLGDYIFGGFVTTRRENGVERTTNTHVLGKGRPGEKVGVERTTRTEYVLIIINRNYSVLVVHMVSYPVLVVPTSHLVVLFPKHVYWSSFRPQFLSWSSKIPQKCNSDQNFSFGRPKDVTLSIGRPEFTHGRRRMYTWPQAQPYQFLVRE